MKPQFTGLWRHPDFLRLWAGETISVFGSLVGGMAVRLTAIFWLGAGALEVAILAACEFAPSFVLGLGAGVWADRLRRKPLMIAADLGRAAALASIPAAAVFDVLTIAQLGVVLVLTSSLSVLFDVAYGAYLPTLIGRGDIVEGNAKLTASASVAEVGSFGVAGWLVQVISGPGAILVDAISFLFSAFFLGRIRAPEPPPAAVHEREHLFREALAGIRVVTSSPILRWIALENMLHMFSRGIIGVAWAVYLFRDVGFDPALAGLIFGIGGLTSLGGAWVAGRAWVSRSLGPSLVAATVIRTVGTAFMPLARSVSLQGYGLLIANQLVTDPAASFYEIREVSLRQSITPDRLLGRVNATLRFSGFGAMLLGTVAVATIGELLGAREALFTGVGVGVVGSVALAVSPVARMRRAPAPLSAAEAAG